LCFNIKDNMRSYSEGVVRRFFTPVYYNLVFPYNFPELLNNLLPIIHVPAKGREHNIYKVSTGFILIIFFAFIIAEVFSEEFNSLFKLVDGSRHRLSFHGKNMIFKVLHYSIKGVVNVNFKTMH